MKRDFHRIISMFLTTVMLVCAVPATALAEAPAAAADEYAEDAAYAEPAAGEYEELSEIQEESVIPEETVMDDTDADPAAGGEGTEDATTDPAMEVSADDREEAVSDVPEDDEAVYDDAVSSDEAEEAETAEGAVSADEIPGEDVTEGDSAFFSSFEIELDTTSPYTEKLSDGTFKKRTDSQDAIIPVYTLLDESKAAEADELNVTFTSTKGTMNFGYVGIGAFPVYTAKFKDVREQKIKVVRCGAGKDTVEVTVTPPDSDLYDATATIDVIQEGWESFMGSAYSSTVYSGRYYMDHYGFIIGWWDLKYDETAQIWLPVEGGDYIVYFNPVSKRPAENITEIEDKKYLFLRASKGDYRPCMTPKAAADRTVYDTGNGLICLNMDGSIETGIVNNKYFDPTTGNLVTNDWVHVGEDVYHTDDEGNLQFDKKITHCGTDYILKDRRIAKGLVTTSDGEKYYCDPVSGAINYGIITMNKKKYLQTEDGIPDTADFHNCLALGRSILTDANGRVAKGGREVTLKVEIGGVLQDRIFYANPDGTMFMGVRKVGQKTYEYTQVGRVEIQDGTMKILDPETLAIVGYGYQDNKGNLVFYTDNTKSAMVKDRIVKLGIDGSPEVIINEKGMISYGFYSFGGKKYYSDRTTGRIYTPTKDPGDLKEVEGKLYYFLKDGSIAPPSERWVIYNGSQYYIGDDARPVTGWQKIDEKTYYFEPSGALHTDAKIGKKYYVVGNDKSIVKPEKAGIFSNFSGSWYLNRDGSIKPGWVSVKNEGVTKRYYTSPGMIKSGFIRNSSKIYRIGGKFYCFDDTGAMRTGWQKDFGYYEDGTTLSYLGNVPNGSEYFYFDGRTGAMATGKKTVNTAHPNTGKTGVFYFGTSFSGPFLPGRLVNGVLKQGSRLIAVEDGQAVPLSSEGVITPGEDGKKYFVSKGKLVSGLRSSGGAKYYFDPKTGEMVKGTLVRISGKWYYFDSDGEMSNSVIGYTLGGDGSSQFIKAHVHTKGYITGFYYGDKDFADVRVRIAGKTYILDKKGKFAKGLYTIASGSDRGITFLAGADYAVVTKGINTVARYGKKHYVVDGEGRVLKNGHYSVGRFWMDAFTEAEKKQIAYTSLLAWGDGSSFYTDSTGAIIKNKVIMLPNGRKSRLGRYGLQVGRFYKSGGAWYCYNQSGAPEAGRYKVQVKDIATNKTEYAYFTIGRDGRMTGGVRRPDGTAVQGYVNLEGLGQYYLDRKGMPSTGTKQIYNGKATFHKLSGRPLSSFS